MTSVFLIAEAGSSWRFGENHIDNAYRMIRAAKECGADAVKFQWCSDAKALALRRNEPQYAEAYKYVEYPREWLALFKAEADRVGIQFGCTAFLPQDVGVVDPVVDFVKIAAKESNDKALREEWQRLRNPKRHRFVVSVSEVNDYATCYLDDDAFILYCVSKYPTSLDDLSLHSIWAEHDDGTFSLWRDGLSDHTGHTLTGAVAVGTGATVVESHIRLIDTPQDNPDYPHSLACDTKQIDRITIIGDYRIYVENVRLAERMCG